jgi:hypothetical protein
MSLNCCASASTPLVLQSAGTGGLEVAVQSFNGFAGQISIFIDPSGLPNGVTAIPSVSSFYLEANQTVEIDVSITATATAFGSGSVRILGSTPDSLLVGTSVTGYLLVNPVNANPGLGAGPFLAPTGTVFGNIPVNLIPPATGTSTITLKSTNHFSGTLNLTATCCTEYLTGLTMRPEGAAFSFDSPSLALAPTAVLRRTCTSRRRVRRRSANSQARSRPNSSAVPGPRRRGRRRSRSSSSP